MRAEKSLTNSMKYLCTVSLWFLSVAVYPQFQDNYTPRDKYTKKSKHLLRLLDHRYVVQLNRINTDNAVILDKYYIMTSQLKSGVKQGRFLKDYSIETLVNTTYKKLIDTNSLTCDPGNVLILRSALINAACIGEGTLLVNVGLLARLQNVSELAFVIAHELAHYEIDHVKKRIFQAATENLDRKVVQVMKKGIKGKVNAADLEDLSSIIYKRGSFSREMEMEADSLGYVFFRNAGFDQNSSIALLDKLDSLEQRSPAMKDKLFSPFRSAKYPFKQDWLSERLSIYNRKATNTFFLINDSTKTHPDISIRKRKLINDFSPSDLINSTADSLQSLDNVALVSKFESVESAYLNKEFDLCLFYALSLKADFRTNKYLTTMISKVLLELFEARVSLTFYDYVPKRTVGYGEDFRLINTFLHNLELKEMGEIAFHFLNTPSNFDSQTEEHYYLLWQICGLTERESVQKNIKTTYKSSFPKGKYLSQMK
jgi:Peptidase family M48